MHAFGRYFSPLYCVSSLSDLLLPICCQNRITSKLFQVSSFSLHSRPDTDWSKSDITLSIELYDVCESDSLLIEALLSKSSFWGFTKDTTPYAIHRKSWIHILNYCFLWIQMKRAKGTQYEIPLYLAAFGLRRSEIIDQISWNDRIYATLLRKIAEKNSVEIIGNIYPK